MNLTNKGTLYLIPNLLGGEDIQIVPPYVLSLVNQIRVYIVENERNARRYLIKLGIQTAIDDLTFHVLDKHNKHVGINGFLKSALEGQAIGLISEAGSPAVADPGALVVAAAHQQKIPVQPLVGPSSILLGLMASGFNGQQFTFHGYLPIDGPERVRKIKRLVQWVQKEGYTQIFIETPYRNNKLLEQLFKHCPNHIKLCVAVDLTLPTQEIFSQSIGRWKKQTTDFHKRPALFLLGR